MGVLKAWLVCVHLWHIGAFVVSPGKLLKGIDPFADQNESSRCLRVVVKHMCMYQYKLSEIS